MKNFSFEKNKNIYIIRYKEWELYVDIVKEIIINNKTGEIIDYNAMRTIVFEDLAKAHDIGKRINFISGLYEELDKTKKNESYISMEVILLYKNYGSDSKKRAIERNLPPIVLFVFFSDVNSHARF